MYVDVETNKEARNAVQNLIRKNKKAYSEEKLKGKQLGLSERKSPCTDICIKAIGGLTFDFFRISELLK